MTSPQAAFNALLIDAPVGRHFAQLHRDQAALQGAIALYVETGLRRGQSILVFSAPATTAMTFARLRANGIDVRRETESGRLRVLDAAACLSRFMRGGMPSWSEFQRAATEEIVAAKAASPNGTRVYGEMVNLLWREGHSAAAIRLEEYWNDMAKKYPFTLFCGYMLDTHDGACYGHPLEEIGRTHVHTEHGDDDGFGLAVEAACKELFGFTVDELAARSDAPPVANEASLPRGLRSMVWLRRTQPEMSSTLLERTRAWMTHQRRADAKARDVAVPG